MQKNVSMDGKDNRNDKLVAAMAYLGILVVVPFFMEKKTQFVRYHLGQGASLFAVEILYGILYQLLAVTVLMVLWRLYLIIRIVGYAAFVFPGAFRDRNHKCGERAGEGTAGDREGQVF